MKNLKNSKNSLGFGDSAAADAKFFTNASLKYIELLKLKSIIILHKLENCEQNKMF